MSTFQASLIASTLDQTISGILTTPDAPISGLDLLSQRNLDQLKKWNSTPLEIVDRTIHDVFHQQAIRRPDHEAVCSWDGSFNYSELDQLVTRLASHLISLGIRPEIRVPLAFNKSVSI
jgi:non-ribosomal peptide synthetase component F